MIEKPSSLWVPVEFSFLLVLGGNAEPAGKCLLRKSLCLTCKTLDINKAACNDMDAGISLLLVCSLELVTLAAQNSASNVC